ncbi:MAG: nucleoside deaminase [Deltaproteobacteria bacterium]|nr:nucleoside deaminase [Deltaproteobacteria bacterium]
MGADLPRLMEKALEEAREAFHHGEVPVGAVLAEKDGRIIASARNRTIELNDPTGHAEILALRRGAVVRENYRLNDCILVVTVEPCVMCMGAIIHARINHLAFGAPDPKWGAAGSLYDLPNDPRLNHRLGVTSGIFEEDCRRLMQDFFRMRR